MAELRDQLSASLSGAYTIERELGGGGMSRVFLAEESRLRRKVVVKVLSPELAAGISAERFEREIQLAASLMQANIVPVLSTGESGGLPYYTMPFVEGESLRSRLMRGEVRADEIPGILRDVARALAYAHERGVVHRDIKPDNVLLSGGAAVVTDFGIAKAIAAARGESAGATLTQFGTSIGTPAYMAPEQAAGDPYVDHRADIYALGCMAYELLSGQPPFAGRTPQRMLAAHMGEEPKPLLEVAPMTSHALATLVMSCLAKDPAARPQSARDLIKALDAIASGTSHETLHASLLARPGLLKWALGIYSVAFIIVAIVAKAAIVGIGLPDWVLPGAMIVMGLGLPVLLLTGYAQSAVRRVALTTPTLTPGGRTRQSGTMAEIAVKASPHLTWRRAAIGGAAALGLFVVAIGTFMALRAAGVGPFGSLLAAGRLGDARILIGDFRATSTDSALGNVVTEAVRADLAQSSALTIVQPALVAGQLRAMQKPAGTRLDATVAREVAIRAGIPAFVTGEVTGLGSGFVVNVRLVGTDSAHVLASYNEVAASPEDLIPVIGKITRQLRGKVGESLRELQNSPELADVMTPSLEALRYYTEGLQAFRAGESSRSIRLMEQAIAIDSEFVAAYRSAATALGNMGTDREREMRYVTKAFNLADRLPDAERHQTRATYYSRVDPAKAIPEFEAMSRLRPNSSVPYNNAAVLEWDMRQFESAERRLRAGIRVDSVSTFPQANLIITLLELGKRREADSVMRELARRYPIHLQTGRSMSNILMSAQELDSAAAYTEAYLRGAGPDPSGAAAATRLLVNVYTTLGRLDDAKRSQRRVTELRRQAGVPAGEASEKIIAAMNDAWYRGDRPAALRKLEEAEKLSAGLAHANRPYDILAIGYALAGAGGRARAMLAEFRKQAPTPRVFETQHVNAVESLIAYAEKRYADGIRAARASDVDMCTSCVEPLLAMNFDQSGQADSAIAAYTRFVRSPSVLGPRAEYNSLFLTGSYKRLGELLEAKGDVRGAIENYERALHLWRNADPVLQPRVADMRKRVDRLRRTGG
ncbi:MAG TPA: protein kinase [Gemmatimonadaceae bacterium]|nr:protein kinase [Gemmatimonadaceae bacterium]